MTSPFTDAGETSKTRDRIMLEAAILFAHRGYAAVSVRDIAERVSIKPASIYNHFESKEALFNVIMDNIREIYLNFYDRLEESMQKATNFEQVLDCFFAELKDVYHMFIYYGVSLITTEQFRDRKARDIFNNVLMRIGIDYAKSKFDECIRKKWVTPFDTEALATLFMNSVLVGTLMRTHENMGHETAYDTTAMFVALQRYMLSSVETVE
jgi:Transcriptional regulator